MAVEVTGGSTDGVNITSDVLDFNSDFTWAMWFRLDTAVVSFNKILIRVYVPSGGYDQLEFTTTGTVFAKSWDGDVAYATSTAGSIATATWTHLALKRDGDDIIIVIDGVEIGVEAAAVGTRGAPTRMQVEDNFGGDFEFFAQKLWTRALTTAEIRHEMRAIAPKTHVADLYGFWPHLNGDATTDYSGRGRNWTESGTLTDFQSPPVGWGRAQSGLIVPTAADPDVDALMMVGAL